MTQALHRTLIGEKKQKTMKDETKMRPDIMSSSSKSISNKTRRRTSIDISLKSMVKQGNVA